MGMVGTVRENKKEKGKKNQNCHMILRKTVIYRRKGPSARKGSAMRKRRKKKDEREKNSICGGGMLRSSGARKGGRSNCSLCPKA